jgi:hypothetical protein
MSYGPNLPDLNRHAAIYIGKVLRGTKPSDLPVEQATKFETVSQDGQGARPNFASRAARPRRRGD